MLADSDLRLTDGTNPVFATICDTSPYFFEFSPFFWQSINVEKVSKFVNKSHAIYAYIITSEELG